MRVKPVGFGAAALCFFVLAVLFFNSEPWEKSGPVKEGLVSQENSGFDSGVDKDTSETNESFSVSGGDLDLPSALSEVEKARENILIPKTPDVNDVVLPMRDRNERYVSLLRNETLEESFRRLYMYNEVVLIQMHSNLSFDYPRSIRNIRYAMGSRRYSKLHQDLQVAIDEGAVDHYVKAVASRIADSIDEYRDVQEKYIDEVRANPQLSRESQAFQDRLADTYIRPAAVFPLGIKEGHLPRTVEGISLELDILANLLGQSGDVDSLAPLVQIADSSVSYSDETAGWPSFSGESYFRHGRMANIFVVASAIDRVLLNAVKTKSGVIDAGVLNDYTRWRKSKEWPSREEMYIYPFDTKKSSYHLPRSVFGASELSSDEYITISLPIPAQEVFSARNTETGENVKEILPGLTIGDAEEIIDWARNLAESR